MKKKFSKDLKRLLIFCLIGGVFGFGIGLLWIWSSRTPPTIGTRQEVFVTEAEHDELMETMRTNLEVQRRLLRAISNKDMKDVKEALEVETENRPGKTQKNLRSRLPMEWNAYSGAMHREYVNLGEIARSTGDNTKKLLQGLENATVACVACHNQFRLTEVNSWWLKLTTLNSEPEAKFPNKRRGRTGKKDGPPGGPRKAGKDDGDSP